MSTAPEAASAILSRPQSRRGGLSLGFVCVALPLKISHRGRQSEPAAPLKLPDESPTVISHLHQFSRPFDDRGRSRVPQAAHFALMVAPSSVQIALTDMRSVMSV